MGMARYDGYFHALELGGWVLLGKVLVQEAGRPWYLHKLHSFVEQWEPESPEDKRWASFGPSFVEEAGTTDSWRQITTARFSHTSGGYEDLTHVNANVAGYGQWGMGIG